MNDLAQLSRRDLETRLEEAEETLRAIRDGEVDALVVRNTDVERVFTLEGDAQSFRTFMEAMDIGAAAFDSEGRFLYGNQALSVFLGRDADVLRDGGIFNLFDKVGETNLRRLIQQAKSGRISADAVLRVQNQDRSLLLTGAPFELGPTTGVAITFTDISERERNSAVEESTRVARAVLTSANAGVVVCDNAGVITHVNTAARRICAGDPVGQSFSDALHLAFADTNDLMSSDDVVTMGLRGTSLQGLEASLKGSTEITDLLVSAAPLVVSGDRTQGCVITLIDVSQSKAAERRQNLLMAELDHRVKNTLAMVLAISSRTAMSERTIEGFQKAFSGRIQALAATHTLLADSSWENLNIREILEAELAPYMFGASSRVVMEGLDFPVDPKMAVSLGLIFHELTTNAVKYGALSVTDGKIIVQAVHHGTDGVLDLEWKETGGPLVTKPAKSGFGNTLIEKTLTSNGGTAKLNFDPAGVQCLLKVQTR